jgi:diguanylate cyclase (GGDEF)-like protein
MTLESKSAGHFSGNEVETMYRLVENAAGSLEVLYMNNLAKEFVHVDQLTGSLTRKFFLRKIEEEVRRAADFATELASVSIAVDGMAEHLVRYGREGCDAILNEAVKILRANIRPYDAVGRLENDRLGVLLVSTAASDAYLWAEKMRKAVSSHVMIVGKRSFSVTLSAGVCGLRNGKTAIVRGQGHKGRSDKRLEVPGLRRNLSAHPVGLIGALQSRIELEVQRTQGPGL